MAPFASAFRAWRAPRIAEGRRPADLAGRPTIVIKGTGPKGSCIVTAVMNPGTLTGAEDAFLAIAPPSTNVFVLPRWMIDRVAPKLADLRAQ